MATKNNLAGQSAEEALAPDQNVAGALLVGDAADPAANAPVNVSAGIDFTILNTRVAARLEVAGDTTKVLVMPVSPANGGMTLTEFITAMGQLAAKFGASFDAASVNNALNQFFNLEAISIEIRQIFFFYSKTGTASSMEYAVDIAIVNKPTKGMEDLSKLFEIHNFSLAVWNTGRTKILDRMSLGSVDNLLN